MTHLMSPLNTPSLLNTMRLVEGQYHSNTMRLMEEQYHSNKMRLINE